MNRLETQFLGCKLKNPVIAASGTFGFGKEYSEHFDVGILGGIASKGLTLNAKDGNSGIRVYEAPAGMLNSIGLQNPGVEDFIENELEDMNKLGPAVIVNLGGNTVDEYIKAAELLNEADFDILELNISCPNVKQGGMAFGVKARDVEDIVSKVKRKTRHPLLVKLSPNAENIVDTAIAAEYAGADGVSLINTILAMAIHISERKAVFDNIYAGLSGPCVMPVALRMVHEVRKRVKVPISGMGGISCWEDAVAFMMAGANTVQVGSAVFADIGVYKKIINGLENYCREHGLKNIAQIFNII